MPICKHFFRFLDLFSFILRRIDNPDHCPHSGPIQPWAWFLQGLLLRRESPHDIKYCGRIWLDFDLSFSKNLSWIFNLLAPLSQLMSWKKLTNRFICMCQVYMLESYQCKMSKVLSTHASFYYCNFILICNFMSSNTTVNSCKFHILVLILMFLIF